MIPVEVVAACAEEVGDSQDVQEFAVMAAEVNEKKADVERLRRIIDGKIKGVPALHVDDMIIGGDRPESAASVARMREKLPFRKRRYGEGEFCGSLLKQKIDGVIEVTREAGSEGMMPVRVRRTVVAGGD